AIDLKKRCKALVRIIAPEGDPIAIRHGGAVQTLVIDDARRRLSRRCVFLCLHNDGGRNWKPSSTQKCSDRFLHLMTSFNPPALNRCGAISWSRCGSSGLPAPPPDRLKHAGHAYWVTPALHERSADTHRILPHRLRRAV